MAKRRELLQEADNEEEVFNCSVFVNKKSLFEVWFLKKVNKSHCVCIFEERYYSQKTVENTVLLQPHLI